MMEQDLKFNFHDLIGVEIDSQDPRVVEFYDLEFKRAGGKLTRDLPTVSLFWGRMNSRSRMPGEYQRHAHKLLARWTYRIRFEPKNVILHARGNELAIPMVHHMLLHPSIRFLASLENTLMLHGSAVAREGQSVILTGKGGAGKTTISSLLLHHGGGQWQLHADDYLFVSPQMKTMGYLTRAHLYLDILDWVPEVGTKLTTWERVKLEFFGRLRRLTGDRVKWPLRISEARLWPNHSWASSASLAAILFLRRWDRQEVQIEPARVDEALIDDVLEMNFHEARHFCLLVDKSQDTGLQHDWVSRWRGRERRLIESILGRASTYWLNVPTNPDRKQIGHDLAAMVADLLRPNGAANE